MHRGSSLAARNSFIWPSKHATRDLGFCAETSQESRDFRKIVRVFLVTAGGKWLCGLSAYLTILILKHV